MWHTHTQFGRSWYLLVLLILRFPWKGVYLSPHIFSLVFLHIWTYIWRYNDPGSWSFGPIAEISYFAYSIPPKGWVSSWVLSTPHYPGHWRLWNSTNIPLALRLNYRNRGGQVTPLFVDNCNNRSPLIDRLWRLRTEISDRQIRNNINWNWLESFSFCFSQRILKEYLRN